VSRASQKRQASASLKGIGDGGEDGADLLNDGRVLALLVPRRVGRGQLIEKNQNRRELGTTDDIRSRV
jgi:hypothetical protein